jgi:hypothetical protein
MKKVVINAAAIAACLLVVSNAQAANWLMLQGTEPASAAERARVWGFIQPTFKYTSGTEVQAGAWAGSDAQFNLHAPHLSSNQQFSVHRARIGVRGQGFPLNAKVNYFFLAEFGSNGITWPKGGLGSAKVTDASVTLNYIPGARIRAGLFKTPGAEEGLQAIHVFDYVNFTSFSDQMLLERFFDGDGSGTNVIPPPPPPPKGTRTGGVNAAVGPVGAFRDIGIQIFDSFNMKTWDLSYAFMFGNGNGINGGDNNASLDTYYYLSAEKVFAGEGPRRQGVKMFAWSQIGKRKLIKETDGSLNTHDRTRTGFGVNFRKSIFRATAEYMLANGMIFNGTDGGAKAGSISTPSIDADGDGNNTGPADGKVIASFNMEPEEEANGYYLHFGVMAYKSLELDVRYDVLNRATKTAAKERKFSTVTLGAQWFFDRKNRLTLNYEIRSAEAPNLDSDHNANKILDGIDNRVSVQITSIF